MNFKLPFRNREEAGGVLAQALETYRGRPGLLVLALPRGGIPVAAVVARTLGAELDILNVRKIGVPGHPELAMGAIASGETYVLNEDLIGRLGITKDEVQAVIRQEAAELRRRDAEYRTGRPYPPITGRSVVVVDDGLATGSTMLAAVAVLRSGGAATVIVGAPVGPAETVAALRREADIVICPAVPHYFRAVGEWYDDFSQITDEEVHQMLENAWNPKKVA